MTLRRATNRLNRVFGALVLAIVPAAAAQACHDGTDAGGMADATPDEIAGDATIGLDTDAADAADAPTFMIDGACALLSEAREAGPDATPDADPGCRYTLPCGLPDGSAFTIVGCSFYLTNVPDGYDASLGCSIPEGPQCTADAYVPQPNGTVTFECFDCFGGGGRRPVGMRRPAKAKAACVTSALGGYFAQMAHDEDASVHAFLRMHADLTHFGAPPTLVKGAARAARDEVRHARVMSRRARAHGSSTTPARVRKPKARSLEAIARENASEGCVNETFGALLLRWQAARASDPALRLLFARIATDETRHAALSWELARWAELQLDERARKRVTRARERALTALRARLSRRATATSIANDVSGEIGQPTPAEALALLDGMIALLGLRSTTG